MANHDEPLLSASVLKNIGDKMYEKRKMAALEVEQVMKTLAAKGERNKVKVLLGKLVNDYALSGQANRRKGGLLCLAAATVALKRYYDRLGFNFLEQIVEPVCLSLSDQDCRVRYYACEALYNIAKAMQDEFISNMHLFLKVFNALFGLYGDTDSNVQNAAQHLDRVLKDNVTRSSPFDVSELMLCLKNNLFALNVHKRQFLIGWIGALSAVPSLDMLPYLPEILPGLMSMLEDTHPEIRQAVNLALEDFLDYLDKSHEESTIDYRVLTTLLLEKCFSSVTEVRLVALRWLSTIVEIGTSEILKEYGHMVATVLSCISHSNPDVQKAARSVNETLLQTNAPFVFKSLDMHDLLEKINKELSSSEEPTKLEALRWLEFLLVQCPNAVLAECESVVNAVLDALTMHWDKVVKSGIHLLGILAKQKQQFRFVMVAILQRFQGREGLKLLHTSGAFVIQSLSRQLGAIDVFREMAVALQDSKFGPEFSSIIVQSLNVLLVTSPELVALPQLLRKGLQDSEAKEFFLVLFPVWSRSICAALSLCFLVQAYRLAWKLIQDFGSSLYGSSADAMVQIVRLVKLIEAPAFAFLRLDLVNNEQNPYLLRSLRGLVMLLPQTDAFHTLVDRLKILPACSHHVESHNDVSNGSDLDEGHLLNLFSEQHSNREFTPQRSFASEHNRGVSRHMSFSFPKDHGSIHPDSILGERGG